MANPEYILRITSRKHGYLSTSSKHITYKREKSARNAMERIEKKNPDCECDVYVKLPKFYWQHKMDFDHTEY